MTPMETQRPLSDVIGGLASDISGLFRKELQLAKAEASEKINHAVGALTGLLLGAVLGLGAIGVLLAAIVTALAAWFVSGGMEPTLANSLAAVIVTVIVGGAAWVMISRGLNALKAGNLMLDRTTHSLAQDAEVVKETF